MKNYTKNIYYFEKIHLTFFYYFLKEKIPIFQEFKENIKILFEDCTVIMITHLIQMVNICENIVVLNNGEIVDCDTYENLMDNKNCKFYSL